MTTYCEPLLLPRCVICRVTHTAPERLREDGTCVDADWCMRNRLGVSK